MTEQTTTEIYSYDKLDEQICDLQPGPDLNIKVYIAVKNLKDDFPVTLGSIPYYSTSLCDAMQAIMEVEDRWFTDWSVTIGYNCSILTDDWHHACDPTPELAICHALLMALRADRLPQRSV